MQNIREFLNKLHIGYKCRSANIKVPFNVENSKIVHFFYEKGWIKLYVIQNKNINIYLRYINNKPLFTAIKFISTSGHRKYFSKEKLSFYKRNNGGNAYQLWLINIKNCGRFSYWGWSFLCIIRLDGTFIRKKRNFKLAFFATKCKI